jgi:hypothetical protein
VLFARFDEQLARRGFVARAWQMIDAPFDRLWAGLVEATRQRNSHEDNAKLEAGERFRARDSKE